MPGATPLVQVLPVLRTVKSASPLPEIAVLMVSEAISPLFVMVRSTVLVVPCVMVPKAIEVADTVTSLVAVPLSETVGLVPPVVVMVSVPVLLPTADGSYSTDSTQLAPAARLVEQVLPLLLRRKPVPVTDSDSL